jgi:hypothetical protein
VEATAVVLEVVGIGVVELVMGSDEFVVTGPVLEVDEVEATVVVLEVVGIGVVELVDANGEVVV